MTESKIKQNKEIRQNTGAILNPASCGSFPTRNFLSVGFTDSGICEYIPPTGEPVEENNLPVIDLNGGSAGLNISDTFTEGDVATAYLSSAVISDADNDLIVSATIVGSGIQDGSSEILVIGGTSYPLNANKTATGTGGSTTFSIAYTTATQTFVITKNGGGGVAIADFQSLIRGISYRNVSEDPTSGNRVFTFTVNDGEWNSSPAILTIAMFSVNDLPVIDLNGASGGINASGTFAEGDALTLYFGSATLTDAGGDELVSLQMTCSGQWGNDGLDEQIAFDTWVTDADTDKTENLVVGSTTFSLQFVASTGILTVTKSGGGTFTTSDGQSLLRLFKYGNSAEPTTSGSRVFEWIANNGTSSSATATLTINVTSTASSLTFTDAITWDQDNGDISLLSDLIYTSTTSSCVEGIITFTDFVDGNNEIFQLGSRIFESGTSRTTTCYHRGIYFTLDYDHTTGELSVSPTYVASVSDDVMQSLMRTLKWWHIGAGLTIGDRTVDVSLDDGTNPALTDTLTISTQVVLTIHVVDYDGAAISGATVTLKDPLDSTMDSDTTDVNGQCTFTITENGDDYTLEVTKSGKQNYSTVRNISGNQNIVAMLFTNAVTIDAAWLANTANLCDTDYTTGPYKLTASDTLYTMTTGLTSDLQAFVFRAKAGLNFNGQDVVYGNEAPVGLTNEGFETGDFTGWDTSAAPSAQVVANAETGAVGPYLWGSYCCQFTNLNGAETISQVMSIPEANRPYRATVWQNGIGSDGSNVKIEAIDNVTESSLGSTTNSAAGSAATVVFTPTTTNDVRIEVTVTTLSTKNPKIDDIRVRHADVFGISLSPSLTGISSWAQGLVGTVFGINGGAVYDSLGTGSLTQGQGESDTADVYRCYSASGYLVIDNTTFSNVGTNSQGVQAIYKGSTLAFTNNTYNAYGHDHHSTNRQAIMAAISMTANPDAGYYIENNTFTDLAQQGISLDQHESADDRIIRNNMFVTDTRLTNAYAVSISDGGTSDILYNTVATTTGKSGRGFLLDDINGACPKDCTVAFNDVAVRERGNYEYGYNNLEATGLRVREFDHDVPQPAQTGHRIKCNRFYAYTDDTLVHTAMAHRGSYSGDNESSDVEIKDNIFRAVVGTTSTTYSATAMEVATSLNNANDPVDYNRNWLDSNDQSFVIGGRDTDFLDSEDVYLTDCEFTKSASGSARTYKTIFLYGNANNTDVHDARIIDGIYGPGAASSDITWTGSGLKDIGIYYTAEVEITAGNAATLTVDDDGAVEVFSGTADSNGYVAGIAMLHTLYEQLTSSAASITTTVEGDYTFTASLAGQTDGVATVTADQPRYIPMDFDTTYGPPNLTPPSTVNATLGDTGVSATITNSGSAADYTELASGTIPDDLALSGLVISGDVNAAETPGTYSPVVRAVNAYGSDTATVTFEIASGVTAPVFEGGTSANTAVQNLVINVPSGNEGDTMRVTITSYPRTVATPAGWDLKASHQSASAGGYWIYVFERARTSSEPANYTFVQSAAGSACGFMTSESGGGESVVTFLDETYGSPLNFPGVTPAANASIVYRIGGTYNNRTVTDRTANGHTDIGQQTTSSGNPSLAAMYRIENAEASGVVSFGLSNGGNRNSVVIVVPPA